MLNILLYRSNTSDGPLHQDFITIARRHGAEIRSVSPHYHCGHWQHPQTKASSDIDIGRPLLVPPGAIHNPTIHDDPHAEPKEYIGWIPCEVTFHLPLTGPHWYVVEIGLWLERLLDAMPECGILISEDIGIEGEPGYGPGNVDRPRLLACWEACHGEQTASLALPRMERRSSLALWRYRREQAAAAHEFPTLHWPQAMVLGKDDRALSTVLWSNPDQAFALPPVDYVVIQRGEEIGLLPADELRTAANGGQALGKSGAVAINPNDRVTQFFAKSKLVAASEFRALHDHDFSD